MRLVPVGAVPKAIAIVSAGSALAATAAAPVGSYLGTSSAGAAFACIVPLAALTLGWQSLCLPSMRSDGICGQRQRTSAFCAARGEALGMAAIMFLVHGSVRIVHVPSPVPPTR